MLVKYTIKPIVISDSLSTHAAADATISWRFARVNDARIAVKIKVEARRMEMIVPMGGPSSDECEIRSSIYTGMMKSEMIAKRLRTEATISRREREYRIILESGSTFLESSWD